MKRLQCLVFHKFFLQNNSYEYLSEKKLEKDNTHNLDQYKVGRKIYKQRCRCKYCGNDFCVRIIEKYN